MEMLFFWFVSVLVSYGVASTMAFKMIKDLADNGYKINIDNVKKAVDSMDGQTNKNKLLFYIPLINIFYSFSILLKYEQSRDHVIDALRIMDTLEIMTLEEQQEYEKNPSAFRALIISAELSNLNIKEESNQKFDNTKVKNNDDLIKDINKDELIIDIEMNNSENKTSNKEINFLGNPDYNIENQETEAEHNEKPYVLKKTYFDSNKRKN